MNTHAHCPATTEDLDIRRRMCGAVAASYALAEAGDWITTRVVIEPGRKRDDCTHAYTATHGLPDTTRSAVAMWAMARTNAQRAAAELARAEEAIQ